MHASREAVVGISTGAAFLLCAIVLGQQSPSTAVRAFSVLAGLGGGGAMGVFAALAAHLARGPAKYEPIEGTGSAWGLAEWEDGSTGDDRRE